MTTYCLFEHFMSCYGIIHLLVEKTLFSKIESVWKSTEITSLNQEDVVGKMYVILIFNHTFTFCIFANIICYSSIALEFKYASKADKIWPVKLTISAAVFSEWLSESTETGVYQA